MKKLFAFVCLASFAVIAGCGGRHYDSEIKRENAKVVQLCYTPAVDGYISGTTGFTTNGDIVFTSGASIHTDENFSVVFKCEEHIESFVLHGKDVYAKCEVGQTVILEYVDKMYEDKDHNISCLKHHTVNVIVPKEKK